MLMNKFRLISSTISKLKFISASYLMKAVASDKLKKEYKIKSSLMDWLISMISLGSFSFILFVNKILNFYNKYRKILPY